MSHPIAAYLAATAPAAADPFHFVAIVAAYFRSLAASAVDTPEEQKAVEDAILKAYDSLTVAVGTSNPALAAVFALLRGYVKRSLENVLLAFAPAPSPTPGPITPVVPQGSAAP